MLKKKKKIAICPVPQHANCIWFFSNFWNVVLEILDLLSLVPKYSGLTLLKQYHKYFLWQA